MWKFPEIRTLPDISRYWAATDPDKVALMQGGVSLTYAELDVASNQTGQALVATTMAGDPVGYLGRNHLELWLLWFGTGKEGRPFVPLDWKLAPPEMAALLEDAGVGIVVVETEFVPQVQAALELVGRDIQLVTMEPAASGGAGLGHWQGQYDTADPAWPTSGQDSALIAYISGTIGRPKGAMIRREAFSLSFLSPELDTAITWDREDVALMIMPNFHLTGTWIITPALYACASLAIVPVCELTAVFDAIDAFQPTFMCLVPTALQMLLDHERASRNDFSQLKTTVYAGSSIGAPTIRKALEILGCEL